MPTWASRTRWRKTPLIVRGLDCVAVFDSAGLQLEVGLFGVRKHASLSLSDTN